MHNAILKQLVSEENTPAYVLDESALRKKVCEVRKAFSKIPSLEICYAMKANPFLVQALDSMVDKFEVCSPGELSICKRMSIPMGKVVMSGVNKEYDDVKRALCSGVEIFTVESWKHFNMLEQCAAELEKRISVLIRLSSDNQFGVDKGTIREMIAQRGKYPHLHICGLHFYSGTQKKASKIVAEIEELTGFCDELSEEFSIEIERLEYGPGMAIDYFSKNEDALTVSEQCADALQRVAGKYKMTIEMGRYLAAECGTYITQVVDAKVTNQQKYCIVDGGINHVNYYGQVMGVRIPPVRYFKRENDEYVEVDISDEQRKAEGVCVCGSLCTSADVLIRNIGLAEVKVGDLFVFEKMGAYSITEGIYLFLSRKLPKVYLLNNGKLKLLRDSLETFEWNLSIE